MNDYRGKMCVLDGEYVAKCIGQDFIARELTFEVEPDGETFTRLGEHGVEVYEQETTFDDVKHKLPKLKESNEQARLEEKNQVYKEALLEVRVCLDEFYDKGTPRRLKPELVRFAGLIKVMDTVALDALKEKRL